MQGQVYSKTDIYGNNDITSNIFEYPLTFVPVSIHFLNLSIHFISSEHLTTTLPHYKTIMYMSTWLHKTLLKNSKVKNKETLFSGIKKKVVSVYHIIKFKI